MSWFLVVLLALTAAGHATAQASNSPLPGDNDVVLRPGDQLRVTVWRKPEYSGEFQVTSNGTLRHPLYQTVVVGGVPLPMARERLRTLLSRYEANPEFVIEPLLRVTVAGAVQQPNLYSFTPEVTMAQAVAQAGGGSDRGGARSVQLTRDGRRIDVDLTRADTRGALMTVRSGDQITVPRRRNIFREYIMPTTTWLAALGTFIRVYRRN
jgi:polysaccharide export outer membrane protein